MKKDDRGCEETRQDDSIAALARKIHGIGSNDAGPKVLTDVMLESIAREIPCMKGDCNQDNCCPEVG